MWVEEDHESFAYAIAIRGDMNVTRREKRRGPSF